VVRLVQPTLQRFDDLPLERGRARVAKCADSDLTAVGIPPIDAHQDFHVARSALTGHHARDFEIRRSLARCLEDDLRDCTDCEPGFYDHDEPFIVDQCLLRIVR
jgi:hypothetical protein